MVVTMEEGSSLHRAVLRYPRARCTLATGTRSCHGCLSVEGPAEQWAVARREDCLGSP